MTFYCSFYGTSINVPKPPKSIFCCLLKILFYVVVYVVSVVVAGFVVLYPIMRKVAEAWPSPVGVGVVAIVVVAAIFAVAAIV